MDNINSVKEILDIFKNEELINLYFSFAQVTNDTESCADYGQCIPTPAFSKIEHELRKLAHKKGFKIKPYFYPRSNACGAVKYNNYIINPDGTLAKCWNEIGNNEYSIGYISQLGRIIITNSKRLKDWVTFNPTQNNNCKKCDILPVCMGGCSWGTKKSNCATIKYFDKEQRKFEISIL